MWWGRLRYASGHVIEHGLADGQHVDRDALVKIAES